MRRFGATVDNLLACDMITVDGRKVRASATDNPDLAVLIVLRVRTATASCRSCATRPRPYQPPSPHTPQTCDRHTYGQEVPATLVIKAACASD